MQVNNVKALEVLHFETQKYFSNFFNYVKILSKLALKTETVNQ